MEGTYERKKEFSVVFMVDKTPQEVFDAVNNVRGWWSQEVIGVTDQLGATFDYHFQDLHRATFQITEFVPGKKVVWHVLDNYFKFTKDKSEWIDTDIVFEIATKGDKTELRFSHVGLVPEYECYEICSNAWSTYIYGSLRSLIIKGQGEPNPIEEVVATAQQMSAQNYSAAFVVDQSAEEIFAAVNNVRGWWSEEIEGATDQLGAEFKFHAGDIHYSTQKISEFVPGEKVVWRVTESRLNFIKEKSEWTGTDIIFMINKQGDKTELHFTHAGLVPAIECYDACSDAWGFYIKRSLFDLVTKGKGHPECKEEVTAATA